MVRSMPSVCSDPRPQAWREAVLGAVRAVRRAGIGARRALSPLGLALLGTVLFGSAAHARPPQRWIQAVFPVVGFAGYTSGFGLRVHPLSGSLRSHDGLDIAAPLGAPVRNWWTGRLVEVIQDSGCGNGLVVRSGDYEHIYCHLAGSVVAGTYSSGPVLLRTGQRLAAGQTIGHVGLSGATTGPHLHWGLRYRGAWLDPVRVLRAMALSRQQARSSLAPRPNVGVIR